MSDAILCVRACYVTKCGHHKHIGADQAHMKVPCHFASADKQLHARRIDNMTPHKPYNPCQYYSPIVAENAVMHTRITRQMLTIGVTGLASSSVGGLGGQGKCHHCCAPQAHGVHKKRVTGVAGFPVSAQTCMGAWFVPSHVVQVRLSLAGSCERRTLVYVTLRQV
jgi:hypothetical protein